MGMGGRHPLPISGVRMFDGKRANPRWCPLHCYPVCAKQRSGHARVAQMLNSSGRPSSQEIRAVSGSGSTPQRLHVKQTAPLSTYSLERWKLLLFQLSAPGGGFTAVIRPCNWEHTPKPRSCRQLILFSILEALHGDCISDLVAQQRA